MLKDGKQIFIVLNHQITNANDKEIAFKRIFEILCELAPKYQVPDELVSQIKIFAMNIKTALTGRLKQNQKLLDHSGYSDFIDAFNQWVKMQDTQQRFLEEIKSTVESLWYQPALRVLREENKYNANLNHPLSDDLSAVRSQKNNLRNDAIALINYEISLKKGAVSDLIQSCQDGARLESKLQVLFTPVYHNVEGWMTQHIGEIQKRISVNLDDMDYSVDGQISNSTDKFTNLAINEILKGAQNKDLVTNALLYGRSLKIPGLKGRWASTLGSWGAKVNIASHVLSLAWSAYSSGKEQDRTNAAHRNQAIAIHQAIDDICSTMRKNLHDTVLVTIETVFDVKIKSIEEKIKEQLDTKEKTETDLYELQQ